MHIKVIKLLVLCLCINTLSKAMCCWCCSRKNQPPAKSIETPMELSKTSLMHLIESSDLEGIKKFTSSGGTAFIDIEACKLAKNKFEATITTDPAQFSMNKPFLVMVIVQALAPLEVKQQLGLPVSEA